ncbi:hypothetical protein, partial [Nonomuraea rubra]|uniref:hypothetical protein n=1 Tax=Nonomuraea rubra TaxID=46180 RepID=UPI0031E6294A
MADFGQQRVFGEPACPLAGCGQVAGAETGLGGLAERFDQLVGGGRGGGCGRQQRDPALGRGGGGVRVTGQLRAPVSTSSAVDSARGSPVRWVSWTARFRARDRLRHGVVRFPPTRTDDVTEQRPTAHRVTARLTVSGRITKHLPAGDRGVEGPAGSAVATAARAAGSSPASPRASSISASTSPGAGSRTNVVANRTWRWRRP